MLHSVASPFLSTGVTAAVFQIDGKTLSFKQRLKKRVKWTEITSFAAINNLLCIKSGPVAFFGIKIVYYFFNLKFSQLNIIYFTVEKCNLWLKKIIKCICLFFICINNCSIFRHWGDFLRADTFFPENGFD